jgi:GPI-anchor transamidase subunit GAA1
VSLNRIRNTGGGKQGVHWTQQNVQAMRARSLLASVSLAGACQPDGAHGLFLKHGIEAVTLRASRERGDARLEQAPLVVEAIFRTFNSLVQKWNQCFYFYLHVDGVSEPNPLLLVEVFPQVSR